MRDSLGIRTREWMGVEPTAACAVQPATGFEDRGSHRAPTTPILSTSLAPVRKIGGGFV